MGHVFKPPPITFEEKDGKIHTLKMPFEEIPTGVPFNRGVKFLDYKPSEEDDDDDDRCKNRAEIVNESSWHTLLTWTLAFVLFSKL